MAIAPDESIETIPGSNLKIIQKKRGYRYSVDALLLAEFCQVHAGDKVIDLGTGSGIVALLLVEKCPTAQMVGLEIQPGLADVARRNVKLNSLEDKITILNEDVRKVRGIFPEDSFHQVVSNPPFLRTKTGRLSQSQEKAVAKHELALELEDLVQAARHLLKEGGRFSLIYSCSRLTDLLFQLRGQKLEPKRLQFIHHRYDEPARLLLVEAVKGAGEELKILPPKILEQRDLAESGCPAVP